MIELWLKLPDSARAAVALLLCAALFTSDLVTAVEMNESQLYPVAMMPLYRVRSKHLLWGVALLAAFLSGLGYWLAPPDDIWDGVTNRGFSIIVIVVTAIAMNKLAEYEH